MIQVTPDISKSIMQEELGVVINDTISKGKMPVVLVDDIKKAELILGYKYVPHLDRFKETF